MIDNRSLLYKDYIRRKYTEEEIITMGNTVGSLMNLRIGSVNVLASYAISMARDELKKTDQFKHMVKKIMNDAVKECDKFDKLMRTEKIAHNKFQIWLDLTDNFQDKADKPMRILHQQIWNALVVGEVKNAKAIAWLVTAKVLVEYACAFYDRLCYEIRNSSGLDFSGDFTEMRLTSAMANIQKVSAMLCHSKKLVDLENDENCRIAFRMIESISCNEDVFVETSVQAMEDNVEMINKEELDDIKRIRDQREEEKREREKKFARTQQKERIKKTSSDITSEDLELLKQKFNKK